MPDELTQADQDGWARCREPECAGWVYVRGDAGVDPPVPCPHCGSMSAAEASARGEPVPAEGMREQGSLF